MVVLCIMLMRWAPKPSRRNSDLALGELGYILVSRGRHGSGCFFREYVVYTRPYRLAVYHAAVSSSQLKWQKICPCHGSAKIV